MLASIGAALLAGLLGSPHCAGMCGGFATACARPRAGLVAWHAGKLATYALLGAAAGTFGAALPGPGWLPGAVSLVLLGWFALALAGFAPEPVPRLGWLGKAGAKALRMPGSAGRFAFGMMNGLLPCGMVYAALAIPVALAHPLGGALAMAAFGLGTVPALTLFPELFRRIAARGRWHRRAVAALVLAAGLWSIGTRSLGGGGHGAAGGGAHGAEPAHATAMHPGHAGR